ncbi:MAG: hypothetical protein EZS28_038925, partial [Streblomastix strix]
IRYMEKIKQLMSHDSFEEERAKENDQSNLYITQNQSYETLLKLKNKKGILKKRDALTVLRNREGGPGIEGEEEQILNAFEQILIQHEEELEEARLAAEEQASDEYDDEEQSFTQSQDGEWGSYQESLSSTRDSVNSQGSSGQWSTFVDDNGVKRKRKRKPGDNESQLNKTEQIANIISQIAKKAYSDIDFAGLLSRHNSLKDKLFAIVARRNAEAEAAAALEEAEAEAEEEDLEDNDITIAMQQRLLKEQGLDKSQEVKNKDEPIESKWLVNDGLPLSSIGKPLSDLSIPVKLTMEFKQVLHKAGQHTFWMPWTEFQRFFEEWDLFHHIPDIFVSETPFLTEKGIPVIDKGDGTQQYSSPSSTDQITDKIEVKEKSGDKQGSGTGEGKTVGKGKEIQIIPEGPPVIPGLPQELHSVAQQCLIQDQPSPLVPPGNDPARVFNFIKTTIPIHGMEPELDQTNVQVTKEKEDKSGKSKDPKKQTTEKPGSKSVLQRDDIQPNSTQTTTISHAAPIPLPLPAKFDSLTQLEQVKKIRHFRRTKASNFHILTRIHRCRYSDLSDLVTNTARVQQDAANAAASLAAAIEKGEKIDKSAASKTGTTSKEAAAAAVNTSAGMGFLPRLRPSEPLQLAIGHDPKKGRIVLITLEVVPQKGNPGWHGYQSTQQQKKETPNKSADKPITPSVSSNPT